MTSSFSPTPPLLLTHLSVPSSFSGWLTVRRSIVLASYPGLTRRFFYGCKNICVEGQGSRLASCSDLPLTYLTTISYRLSRSFLCHADHLVWQRFCPRTRLPLAAWDGRYSRLPLFLSSSSFFASHITLASLPHLLSPSPSLSLTFSLTRLLSPSPSFLSRAYFCLWWR